MQCWGLDATSVQGVAFTSVSVGISHACGIRASDGEAMCWPSGGKATVPEGVVFASVAAGYGHDCGVRQIDGAVICWGADDCRQATPPAETGFSSVTVGDYHSCALRSSDQTVVCWGVDPRDASNGSMRCEDDGQASPPTGDRFRSIDAGPAHTCGIRASSARAQCWGDPGNFRTVVPAAVDVPYSVVSAGNAHNCGIRKSDGHALCWDRAAGGAIEAPSEVEFSTVSAGCDNSCGIRASDGLLICWGLKPLNYPL